MQSGSKIKLGPISRVLPLNFAIKKSFKNCFPIHTV